MQAKENVWSSIGSGDFSHLAEEIILPVSIIENETNGFEWKENKKEFSWQGKMYDVLSLKASTDNIVIRCLADEKENEINQLVVKTLMENYGSREHQEKTIALMQHAPKDYIKPLFILIPVHDEMRPEYGKGNCFPYTGLNYLQVILPPPKNLS